MTVHDNFEGSSHCVECAGKCRLTGDDAALTDLVRHVCEYFALHLNNWLPPQIEKPLRALRGKDWAEFWEHAKREQDGIRHLFEKKR